MKISHVDKATAWDEIAKKNTKIEKLRADLKEEDAVIRRMDDDESWMWPEDLRDAVGRSLARSL